MDEETELYRRRFERERQARKQAEAIIEAKSRELYLKGIELQQAIEAERRARQEVERLSRTDPLTGLFNRRHLEETLRAEYERARRYNHDLSLAMIDVDHFKRVNDRYGHPAGDRVLAEVADVCRRGIRTTDLAARYGGEEFCLVLPQTGIRAAVVVAERVRALIEELRFESPDGGFQATVSIGVAAVAGRDVGWEPILSEADQALYRAKKTGRNRVVSTEAA